MRSSDAARVHGALGLLHGWHLWSLDAPTVAAVWALLFGHVFHLRHAGPAAAALALAVWTLYVADRLLDAQAERRYGSRASALSEVYRVHGGSFAAGTVLAAVALIPLLLDVPRTLTEAWLLLGVPMLGYGIAVHLLRMPARWKPVCVALFFAASVAMPVAVQQGVGLPLLAATVAFGAVCRANCAVLARTGCSRTVVILGAMTGLIAACAVVMRSESTLAAGAALLLLLALRCARERMAPLTYRALADLALVVPAVVLLVR